MNDNLMFDYLLQMGAMRPEEEEMARKQKMVDALRQQATDTPQGQMVSGHYVAPSFTQYAAQLANAYGARKGQQGVNAAMQGMNDRQRLALEEMRRRYQPGAQAAGPQPTVPSDNGYSYY